MIPSSDRSAPDAHASTGPATAALDAACLRALLAGSLQGVLVHRDQQLLFVNDTLAEMLGYASVQALLDAGPSIGLVAPHDRERVEGYFAARRNGEPAPERYEFDALRADGSVAHMEVAVRSVQWDGELAVQSTLLDVTDRRLAEAALRASEARYRELAQTGNDFYWETDAAGNFIHVSYSVLTGTSLASPSILGKSRAQIAHRSLEPARWRACEAAIRERQPFRDLVYQVDPTLANGEEIWLRVSGLPRFDDAGDFVGYRGTGANVTEEVGARERARTAESILATALQSMSDGFALFDAHGRLLVCNEPYRRVLTASAAERAVPGVTFESLLRAQIEAGYYRNAIGREEEWIEGRLKGFWSGGQVFEVARIDGGWHQVRDHHCPDGSIIVLCNDITGLKRREAQIVESEQRARDYVEASSDWYWETDARHCFTFLSRRFTELTGIDTTRFLGRCRADVAPDGAEPGSWRQHLDELAQRRPFRDFSYFTNAADGRQRWFRVNGIPRFGDDGAFLGYRGTGVDCTVEREASTLRVRYIEAIEVLSDSYALFDADDRLVSWNSMWFDLATPEAQAIIRPGVSFEAIVRANVSGGYFPKSVDDPEAWIAWRLERHRECDSEFELQLTAGRWFQVRERRTPRGDVLQIYNEITELKRREVALLESEERFRGFAETAADWLFELDRNLRFTFVSQRFEVLTGISTGSLLGRPFVSIVAVMARDSQCVLGLLASLHNAEEVEDVEFEGASETGMELIHSVSARPLLEDGVLRGYRGSGRDVTKARQLSVQLAYQATHDELTGLVNRREFELRLARVLASASEAGVHHALCYVDLDQFKVVNDTCGHAAGDELLRQLGRMLKDQVRSRDTLARLGGDEFALLLEHCTLTQAQSVANGLRTAIEGHDFTWQGKAFRVGASVGLVPIDGTHVSASDALRAADSACYLAKDFGRNRVHVYASGDSQIARREGEMNWVARINEALAGDCFQLHAQPIAAAGKGSGLARRFELLVRMVGDEEALIAPGAFLPAAERYGLANRIDRWVVSHAFSFLASNRDRLPAGTSININLSGQSLGDEGFFDFLVAELARHGLPAGQLCFEVTETATIADLAGARRFMDMVRGQGCHFALDDFGTGLSSFAYLRDLPVDFVKIDGAFIRDIEHDPISHSMVRSINDIVQVLGKKTIAEYVTSAAIARLLREMGVDYLQGFGIGHPVPLETLLGEVAPAVKTAQG